MTPSSSPSPRRWFYLFITTLAQTALATIHMGIPTLVPLIQKELSLSLTEVGILVSMINVGVVAAVLAAGKAADRYGERRIIGYGTAACGVLVLTVFFARDFPGLLVLFLLLGLPIATGTPAGSKAIAGWFPDRERGTAMGIRQTGIPLGGTIAALTLPSLGLVYGWRPALSVVGVITVATGVLVLLFYREPERARAADGAAPAVGLREIIRSGDIWAGAFYAAVLAGCQWCYISYIELYLTEDVLFSLVFAAALLAVGQACGGAGRIGFGIVSDRAFYGRRVPVLMMLALLGSAAGAATAFLSPGMPWWLVAAVVSLLGLGTMSWQGLYLALVAKVVGIRIAGVAIGLTNTVAFAGVVVLPPAFGFIADYTESYKMAWIALAIAIAVPLPFLWRVREDAL
ncbi:MAG: MFS transporter [Deltaproteobacteria bacterium]|nr:MFS transporter [Deltaproteobacteria bacterium]